VMPGRQGVIFQPVVETVSRTMNLPVSVWVFDEQSQTLRIKAAVGLSARYVRKAFLSLSEPSVTGECFTSGKVVIVHNVLSDPRWKYTKEAKEAGWKSVFCVPIQSHGAVIGVINIYTFVERDFSDLEKKLLEDYAAQIGLALEADRRLKTLRRLLDIGDEFGRLVTGKPKLVLKEIVRGACEVTGADCAVIYPYDAAREEFYDIESVAHHGLKRPLELKDKPRRRGLGAYVVSQGEVVVSNITQEDHTIFKGGFLDREDIKAFMGIALKMGERVLGILYVDFRALHEFSEEEQNTIHLFAHQAAIAIDNSRLYQQANTRAEALKRLHEVGPTLVLVSGAPGSLKNILKQIVQNARRVLGADLVDLYQYIQRRDEYVLPPLQVGKRYCPSVRTKKIYADDVICTIIENRLPQYFPEAQQESILTQPFTEARPGAPQARFVVRESIRSTAAVPLIVGTEVVGVLFANYRSPQTFPQPQRELIELFASQAAIAIRNARLFEQRRALQDIARDITRILNKEDLLQRILARSLELLGCEAGSIALWNKATNQLEFQYAIGKERGLSVPFGEGLIGTAAATGKPICVGDVTKDPRYIKHVPETRSELDVPMLIGEELIGVLNVESTRYNAFDEDSEELAVVLAGQAAVALHNVALFQQRAALGDIARDIVSELDRDALIQKIIERSTVLIGCETGAVGLVDPNTNAVIYKYGFGLAAETLQPIPHGKGLTGKAIATGKPVRVGNVRKVRGYIEHLPSTNSELIVPLKVGQAVLGVLDFQSPRLDVFDDHAEEFAIQLAGHAAVALQNANLFQRTQERLDQRLDDLKALQDVYEAIVQAPLEAILRLVTERAVKLTSAHYGNLWLLERERNELRFGFEMNLLDTPIQRVDRIPVDQHSINGWVAFTGKPYLCEDVASDEHYQKIIEEVRSELAVPLRHGNRIIGTLNVESTKLAAFTEDHKRLLEALAGQAAIAIDNARVYDRLNTLIKVSQEVTSTLELDKVLDRVLEESLKSLGANYGTLRLLNRSTGELVLRAHRGVVGERTHESILLGEGIVGWVAKNEKPFLAGDVRKESQYLKYLAGTCCELAVPIKVEYRTIGVLNIEHPQPYAFDEHDMHLLEAIASQAAAAIRNVQSYQAMQTLNKVGQALTSGIRLREDGVLELIHSQASKLMDTNNMYIALYDEPTDTVRFGLAFVDGKRIDVKKEEGWQPRRAGKGKTEEIIHTKKPIFHTTKVEAETWYAQPGHEEYVGAVLPSWLGVPMMVGEKVLGVIATYHPMRDYVYSGDDLVVLQGMASQAAIALDNAHMFYDINRRLEALVEFGQTVTSGIRLREDGVLELIHSQASKLMDTNNMYIALYDEPTDTVRFGLAFVDGKRIDVATTERWQPRKAGKGRTEEIIRTRKPIFTATKAEAEAWYAQPEHTEYVGATYASWLGVPMMVGEKVLGVIATYHPMRDYVYSGDDLVVLQGMASQAAIALDNTRLYEEARSDAMAARQLATLGTAMAALQHRINNSFNIIVPNVTRLRNRVDVTDKTIAEILDIIERNAHYASAIIARIQEPLREIEPQDVDVNAVLGDVVGKARELWQADTTRPMVEVTLDLDDSIPQIRAPIGQVAEVFRNLVDNAYRAIKAGGKLLVTSRLTDDTICVQVQDTGPGIPLQVQQRLFIKPVPSKDPGGGSGLGLWLSNLMLQSIGGSVIIGKSDSTGTTMLVKIPAPGARLKEV